MPVEVNTWNNMTYMTHYVDNVPVYASYSLFVHSCVSLHCEVFVL